MLSLRILEAAGQKEFNQAINPLTKCLLKVIIMKMVCIDTLLTAFPIKVAIKNT